MSFPPQEFTEALREQNRADVRAHEKFIAERALSASRAVPLNGEPCRVEYDPSLKPTEVIIDLDPKGAPA